MSTGMIIPAHVFLTREKVKSQDEWVEVDTNSIFLDKKVLVFSSPGAFTQDPGVNQLPDFEKLASKFKDHDIEDIYCLSVNDAFVMNAWAKANNLENVKMLPDGSGVFTLYMNMLVSRDNVQFGQRSWRYAMVVENGVITHWFEEPDRGHNVEDDPYGETSPQNILKVLENK